MLECMWEKNLKQLEVKLPKKETVSRDVLEFLYKNEGVWCSKADIISAIDYKGNDLQAPRHLPSQGWNIEQDHKGNYRLINITQTNPNWKPNKRSSNINFESWESIKQSYNNKCASCGSEENKPHNHTGKLVKLEKGHKNPEKGLSLNNIIPQCNYCNKRFKDIYKFDNYGIPVEIKLKGVWHKIPNYNRK